jgi:hypothetical protein
MPTVLRVGPYRFFFYAGDGVELPHIHVQRDDCEAKFWLQPVRLATNVGFARAEIRRIQSLVQENEELILERWREFFKH